jgi:hypothetical protein
MYSLKKDGNEIALANTMHYIRMQENGAYGLCDKREADGVAADNTVYLFGKDIDTVDFVDGVAELEILNIILEGEE